MERPFEKIPCWVCGSTIVAGLLIDRLFPPWGEYLVAGWVWAVFLWLYRRSDRELKAVFLTGLVLAVAFELFCSEVWKVYEYRGGRLLLYVPPGHVLLYDLGRRLSSSLPQVTLRILPAVFIPYAVCAGLLGFDTQAIFWLIVFLAFLALGSSRKFYATMFLAAMILELWGTSLGLWTWKTHVPYFDLTTTNPPLFAGMFYCVGDLAVLTVIRLLKISWRRPLTQATLE